MIDLQHFANKYIKKSYNLSKGTHNYMCWCGR